MKGYSAGEGTGTMAKKALVGAQNNLPEGLKSKIEAAPGKMYDKTMAKQTIFPNSPKTKKVKNERRLAEMDAEYAKGLAARISVDNPEHKGGDDDAWERMQNDHDVDDNGVPQTGAKEYYIKTGKKPDSK